MRNITFIISAICLIFFTAVALDISPLLRGPSVAEWRWPYQFINTFAKVWAPGLMMVAFLGLFWWTDPTSPRLRRARIVGVLVGLVILSFLWQLSVVHFSRAGIGVLYHRTTEAGLNGYYTAGLNITDPQKFLTSYPNIVNFLPMHAKGHPPGGAITYYFASRIITDPFVLAVASPLAISFLSGLAIVLVFLITQSFRAAFFTATIPGLALFLPLLDVIYPLFGLLAVWFLTRRRAFAAGLVFGLGLFFSYSIWPVFLLMIPFFKSNLEKFLLGGAIFFAAMYLLVGYNAIATTLTIIGNQAPRSFLTWLIYNPYDFIVFLGIPLAVLAWVAIKNKLLIVLFFVFLTVFSRAEVGRIWLPIALMVPVLTAKLFDKNTLTTRSVMLLLGLQMVQTLVIQEFWVPLW